MSSRSIAVLLASTAFVFDGSLPAAAIEAEEAADALVAAVTKGSNVEASYESAELSENDVVIEGFTIVRKSESDTVKFEEVVITAPSEGDNGVFQSPEITFTGGALSGEVSGSIGEVTITDATVLDAAKSASTSPTDNILFRTADASGLRFTLKDQPGEVTIDSVSMESGNVVDNIPQDSKGSVEGITLSAEIFGGSPFKPETFGYDKLVFDVSWDGSRDLAARTATIRDLTLSVHDGGDLSISGVVGDLPDPRTLDDAAAASNVGKTKVHELTIRYDDNSLAGRILDFMAKQQGVSRPDYAKQISDALPFLLLALNNPAFQQQVTAAVAGFLNDPQSLTIEIAPELPVSGDDLMALAKSEPGAIPDRLKASVTANTPE